MTTVELERNSLYFERFGLDNFTAPDPTGTSACGRSAHPPSPTTDDQATNKDCAEHEPSVS